MFYIAYVSLNGPCYGAELLPLLMQAPYWEGPNGLPFGPWNPNYANNIKSLIQPFTNVKELRVTFDLLEDKPHTYRELFYIKTVVY